MGMNVGVMGATGLVGTEMLRVLEERAFPVDAAEVVLDLLRRGERVRLRHARVFMTRGAGLRDVELVGA